MSEFNRVETRINIIALPKPDDLNKEDPIVEFIVEQFKKPLIGLCEDSSIPYIVKNDDPDFVNPFLSETK